MASSVVLLPCAPTSVSVARRALSDDLRAAGVFEQAVLDAVLVISELLSNAILHAHPLAGARLRVAWVVEDGRVEIAVSDGGSSTRPHAGDAAVSALGGRGLSIVSHLSNNWGVRTEEIGLTVWAVLAAPRPGHVDVIGSAGLSPGRSLGPAAAAGRADARELIRHRSPHEA